MGVAALGLMMGQMQEANKDDYSMGAMLGQLKGTIGQEQGEAMSGQNSPVGSIIQQYMSGSGGGAAPQNAGAFGAGGGSGGGLGQILQGLLSGNKGLAASTNDAARQAQNPAFSPEETQKRQQNMYDNSGSATNWAY